MSVTRTPLTLKVDHLGRSARSQLRLEPPDGKLQRGEHLVERRFPLGVEDPCREHPAIHPPRDSNSSSSRVHKAAPLEGSR